MATLAAGSARWRQIGSSVPAMCDVLILEDKDLGAQPGEPDGFVVATETLQLHPELVVIYAAARALTARDHALHKSFMLKSLVALAWRVIG